MIDKIFNADCLEGMKRIPNGIVDFVLTDLPFGVMEQDWDVRIDLQKFWEQINRVSKINAASALFAQLPFGVDLINHNRKNFRYEFVVEKKVATGFLNAKKMPLRCHENILVFYRKLPTYNPQWTFGKPYTTIHQGSCGKGYGWRRCRKNHVTNSNDGRRYPRDVLKFHYPHGEHITQKPTDLLEYLIKTYTNEGELVLDATIGSGSTAVAAINTGRHFIGFETEKKFFDIANERIAKAYEEQGLFKQNLPSTGDKADNQNVGE